MGLKLDSMGDSMGDMRSSMGLKLDQLSQEVRAAAEKAGAAVDKARADLAEKRDSSGRASQVKASAANQALLGYMPHTTVADPSSLMPHPFLVKAKAEAEAEVASSTAQHGPAEAVG